MYGRMWVGSSATPYCLGSLVMQQVRRTPTNLQAIVCRFHLGNENLKLGLVDDTDAVAKS